MLLPRSTDVYPKELARDMREFFTSLLAAGPALAPLLFGGQHERVGLPRAVFYRSPHRTTPYCEASFGETYRARQYAFVKHAVGRTNPLTTRLPSRVIGAITADDGRCQRRKPAGQGL